MATNWVGSVVGVGRVVCVGRGRVVVVDASRPGARVTVVVVDVWDAGRDRWLPSRPGRRTTATTATATSDPGPARRRWFIESRAIRWARSVRAGAAAGAGTGPVRGAGVVEDDGGVRVGELVGPPHRDRWHHRLGRTPGRLVGTDARSDGPSAARSAPTGARGCRARGCSCAPSGRRRPGVAGRGRPPRPPPPRPRATNATAHIRSIQPRIASRGGRRDRGPPDRRGRRRVVPGGRLRWPSRRSSRRRPSGGPR